MEKRFPFNFPLTYLSICKVGPLAHSCLVIVGVESWDYCDRFPDFALDRGVPLVRLFWTLFLHNFDSILPYLFQWMFQKRSSLTTKMCFSMAALALCFCHCAFVECVCRFIVSNKTLEEPSGRINESPESCHYF